MVFKKITFGRHLRKVIIMKKERLSIIDKGFHHASLGVANIGKTWYKKRLSCQVGIFAKFTENGKFAEMDNFRNFIAFYKIFIFNYINY